LIFIDVKFPNYPNRVLYISVMKYTTVLLVMALGISVPSVANATTFKDCSSLNKTYPNGVAQSAVAAKKQINAPKIAKAIYMKHKKLDVDKDGTVCEKDAPTTGANPLGGQAPEDFLMPNVICMNLQVAQDAIQDHGVFLSRSRDATGRNRSQLIDRNWIVIKQSPAPGKKIGEGDAVLSVVKIGESTGGRCK